MRLHRPAVVVVLLLLLVPSVAPIALAGGPGGEDGGEDEMMGPMGPGPTTNPYLYHAEAAARWLMSKAVNVGSGMYKWAMSDLQPNYYYLELSNGASGIGTFFARLYAETGNTSYLDYAEGAAKWIMSKAVPVGQDAAKWPSYEGTTDYDYDKFAGVGAIGEFMLYLYQVSGTQTYLDQAKKAANWLVTEAISEHGGLKWETFPGYDFNFTGWAHGVAGICDFFRKLSDETGDSGYMDIAEAGARWLIATARAPAQGQYAWVRIETDADVDISWCGGTTGIVLFFVLMHESTGNQTYLDYAKGGGNWMISQAQSMGEGMSRMMGLNIFCHGDPSCAYVLFKLYSASSDAIYLRYAEEVTNWTVSLAEEVGEDQAKWVSIPGTDYYETGFLRGVPGVGHHLLYAYNVSGRETYLDWAVKAANWTGAVAIEVSPGVEKWNWEEEIRDGEEYCTGWYYGPAGIGLFFLEMVPYWTPDIFHGVEVEMDDDVLVGPGETVQARLVVWNRGNVADTFEVEVASVPQGWDVEVDIDVSGLTPDGNGTGTIDVTAPEDAVAGTVVTISIKVISSSDQSVTEEPTLDATVKAIYGLDILGPPIAAEVQPGGHVEYPVTIDNLGNSADTMVVTTSAVAAEWSVDVVMDDPVVQPWGSSEVVVNVTSPTNALFGDGLELVLTASSTGDPEEGDSIEITTTVGAVYGVLMPTTEFDGEVAPGGTMTVLVPVMASGNAVDDVTVAAISEAVPGWDIRTTFDGDGMGPGETRFASVVIEAPEDAPAWTQTSFTITASSEADEGVTAEADIVVEVLHEAGLGVTGPQGKEGEPGGRVEYVFVVSNLGNANDTVHINATSFGGWAIGTDDPDGMMVLGPGEARDVTVTLDIPVDARGGAVDTLTFEAASTLFEEVGADAVVDTMVLAVPSFKLEAAVTNATIGQGGIATFNITVTNTGNVDLDLDITVSGGPVEWTCVSVAKAGIPLGGSKVVKLMVAPEDGYSGPLEYRLAAGSGGLSGEISLQVTVMPPPEPPKAPNGNGSGDSLDPTVPIVIAVAIVASMAVAYILWKRRRTAG